MPPPPSHTMPSAHKRFVPMFVVAAIATAVFAAGLAWGVGGERSRLLLSDVGTVLTPMIACVGCIRAGLRHERLRGFWWQLGAACGAWMLGEMVWTWSDLTVGHGPPVPSWADLGYLAFIPLAAGALLHHPEIPARGTSRARSLLDGFSIAVALLFLSWTFLLGPLWPQNDLTSSGAVMLAYPVGDIALMFFVLIALRRMRTARRLEMWCLLIGLFALALADSAYAYVVEVRGYTTGHLLDTGWFAGFLAIALAAFTSGDYEPTVRKSAALPALASLVAPLVPMLIALAVAGATIDAQHRPGAVAVTLVLALISLALLRQALLVRDLLASGRGGGQGTLFGRLAHAALAGEHAGAADDEP